MRAQTSLDPEDLTNPKSWFVQHRPRPYWVIAGVYGVLALAWILLPLFPRRRPPFAQPVPTGPGAADAQ